MTFKELAGLENKVQNLEVAFATGDADDIIASANSITRQLGGTPNFNTVEEFRQHLRSGVIDEL